MTKSLLATAALATTMMFGGQSPSDASKPANHSSTKTHKQAKAKKTKHKKPAKQTARVEFPR